jgi:hypothetical protein
VETNLEELGQICLGTPFGDKLYELCAKTSAIKTVVEIGTWKGRGSTECLINGLLDSGKHDVSFMSLEADAKMYEFAQSIWKSKLPIWAKLVYGRIIEIEEMDSSNLGFNHPDENLWFEQDRKAFLNCPNVISAIPTKIDFLFLDGGEFSTYAEYVKLKDRCTYIGMDDTTSRKCRLIRNEVLANLDKYEIMLDNPWYRNGVMIYKNKTNQ